jgi:hypothetical protein
VEQRVIDSAQFVMKKALSTTFSRSLGFDRKDDVRTVRTGRSRGQKVNWVLKHEQPIKRVTSLGYFYDSVFRSPGTVVNRKLELALEYFNTLRYTV